MNLDRIIFTWGVGSTGWGVVGINFMLHWPGVALTLATHPDAKLPAGDPRAGLLADRIAESRQLTRFKPAYPFAGDPLFIGLDNSLAPNAVGSGPVIAFPVFEDVDRVSGNIELLRGYRLVVTASQWNHDVLAAWGVESHMVHQGYDPRLFHPGVRRKATDGRFHVYSGGKAEWRKGQDLVLEGFKIFAEKHDDAVLHAAWASPWPQLAKSFGRTRLGAVPGSAISRPNFASWAQKAGIKRRQFEIVPLTPNHLMPQMLAGMDCAVFASRFEGGTNISAMECLGCGIPTILSESTGHRDLPNLWPANSPEEIAAALQMIYENPDCPAVPPMDHFAWPARIAELVGVLKDV